MSHKRSNAHRRAGRWAVLVLVTGTGLGPQPLRAQVTTAVEWQRCIGGSGTDWGTNLIATSDGGFVCAGWSDSSDGDATDNHGANDVLVAKLDANGSVIWKRSFGGSSTDIGAQMIETSDGTIMLCASTASNDGDVTLNQGDMDLWVVKLATDGTIIWQRTYGGTSWDGGGQILELPGGGYLIHSSTASNNGDVVGFHGSSSQDDWFLKLDDAGNIEWSRAIGGSGLESAGPMMQTSDGGFLACFTYTESSDGDVTNYQGNGDCWLVKLSATGTIEWQRTIGGSQREWGQSILELANGDIVMLGTTASSDGDIAFNQGGYDVLLARLNSAGTLLWARTYGGSQDDDCRTLQQADDGGFILAGSSRSNDGDLSSNQGETDVWVVKVDATGALQWQTSKGGGLSEWAFLYGSPDGILLSGITNSSNGDVQGHIGERDIWIVKLDANGDAVWQRCLGGSAEDWGYVQALTPGNGLVACGYTESNDGDVSGNHGGRDIWVVKLKVTEPTVPPECALFIPNAFSPDKNSTNDAQCIYGTDCVTSMTFNIFDRWGNKVFESTDPNACWDGTYNGQPLDPAVFVYHLSATLNNSERVERQGNITLMR